MEYAELPAPPPLNELIRCFWFLRGTDAAGEPQPIVADGRLEIVLHLADSFARLDAHGTAHRQDPVLLAGQMTAPLHVRPTGVTDVVGIRFRTSAAAAVLRVPLAELTNRVESLADCDGGLGAALFAAAAGCTDPRDRVAALSPVLIRAVRRRPDPLAASIVHSLDAPDAPRVGHVADGHGVNVRTIERTVLASTGLSPSRLRCVLRFRRAFRLLDIAPAGTWAHVAAETGYFDQAHLIRDFRRFAGAPPSQFFRTEPDLARAIMGHDGLPPGGQ